MNFETSISRYADSSFGQDEAAASRKRRITIGLAVLIALLLVAGYVFYTKSSSGSGTSAASKSDQAPAVTVAVPGRTLVAGSVTATGSLAARYDMPVGVAGEGGLVSRVWVDAGTWVRAGQVLASIERSVQVQQANQGAAQIAATEADARLAQNELERAQALAGRGFVSKADIDRKTAQRDAAAARVSVARAQLAESRARMGRLDIRAPADGLVLARSVEAGQVVGPGSGTLFRIAKGGLMEMRAQLAEGDLAKMFVGLAATVTPVGTTAGFKGQIWQLPPVIDPQTRQGLVKIALAYDKSLRPGGFASANIVSGTVTAPLLTESAVQSDATGNFVYIIGKENKVERRDVKIGSISDAGMTIIEGLTGAEQVVITAGAFLSPGETVRPKRASR